MSVSCTHIKASNENSEAEAFDLKEWGVAIFCGPAHLVVRAFQPARAVHSNRHAPRAVGTRSVPATQSSAGWKACTTKSGHTGKSAARRRRVRQAVNLWNDIALLPPA